MVPVHRKLTVLWGRLKLLMSIKEKVVIFVRSLVRSQRAFAERIFME